MGGFARWYALERYGHGRGITWQVVRDSRDALRTCRLRLDCGGRHAGCLLPLRGRRIQTREALLTVVRKVRIRRRDRAGGVKSRQLIGRQGPSDRCKVVAKLLFVARADKDRRDRRSTGQPVEGNLWNRLAGFARDLIQDVDDLEQAVVVDRRPVLGCLMETTRRRERLATAPGLWYVGASDAVARRIERHVVLDGVAGPDEDIRNPTGDGRAIPCG